MEQLRQVRASGFQGLRLVCLGAMWPVGSCIQACVHPRLMASLNSIDDSNWEEVKHINCYATFMGYLWMAMRGLSLLVVTWTTVVLLGGFVSLLDTKDFWCLTVITLVQTAGVFSIHPSENLAAIPRLCLNFLRTMNFTMTWKGAQARTNEESICGRLRGHLSVGARKLVAFGVALIQAMVFSIILCPVAALYGFGMYITTAIALWRLIEHDYGISGGEQTANMNPALCVLYLLAVLQGVVFCYRRLLHFAGKNIASQVAQGYKFEEGVDSSVLDYLDETRIKCETDPSFARGKNLITYAVNLMESHSPDDLLSGTRILDTLIPYDESRMESRSHEHHESSPSNVNTPTTRHEEQKGTRIWIVTERLIGSSSSGKIFQKLLKALDSRSPCNAEMTKRAARIVCALASDIRLKQFPGGIRCISSLLDASLHEVNDYKELMLQGLLIIEKLATDEDNCTVMSDTNGLVSMIMRPLSGDLLHHVNHGEWSNVVDASLRLMCTWLNTATGKSGENVCSQITLNKEAISAMETILICGECHKERRILAMKVLVTQIQDQENIIVQLLGIFIGYKKDEYTTGLAGEKLRMLSKESKSNAKIILEANNGSVEAIVRFVSTKANIRICAAGILEGLCSHYTTGDDCFEDMKTLILTELMPEVLTEILPPFWSSLLQQTLPPDVLRTLPDVLRTLPSKALQKLAREEVQTLLPELKRRTPCIALRIFYLEHETLTDEEERTWLHGMLQKCHDTVIETLRPEELQILLQILPPDVLQTLPPALLWALPHDVLQTLPQDLQMEINAKKVEWHEKKKLQVALLSLWLMVYDKVIIPGPDLPPLFTKIASQDPEFNFPRRLMEMVEMNSWFGNEVDCLRILKLVAKMTISMMRHKHIYNFSNLERLIASLNMVAKKKINLDAFVHLSGSDGGDTLGSLVQKAGKLFHTTEEGQQPEDKKKGKEQEIGPFEHGQSESS